MKKKVFVLLFITVSFCIYTQEIADQKVFTFPKDTHLLNTASFKPIRNPIILVDFISDGSIVIYWGFIKEDKIIFFHTVSREQTEDNRFNYCFKISDRQFMFDNMEYQIDFVEISVNYVSDNRLEGTFHEIQAGGAAHSSITLLEKPKDFIADFEIINIKSIYQRAPILLP